MKKKLLFLLAFILTVSGFSQTIKPYLQAAKPNSIYVNWKTDNGNNPEVLYGTSADNLNNTAYGTTENLEPKDTDYNTPYHYHTVKLTGLTPNTGYYYKVTSGTNDESAVHYFKTPPNLGDNTGVLRFIALGDHQIINYNGAPYMKFNELVQAAKAKAEEVYGTPLADNFNLIMNDGDQVDLGKLEHYEKIHFEKTSYITPDLPLITAVGNHETYGGTYQNGPLQAYYDHFVLDDEWTYGGISSGTERYYAYQLANVLFVVLDTELNSTTQENWLQSVMNYAATDANVNWVISIAHRPYQAEQYSNDYSSWFANTALPVLEGTDKYVLHMAGHHHLYARGQFKDFNGYHIISGGTAWPQYWGDSSNEDDRAETQGTWSDFAYQFIEINNITQELSVKSYTIGSLFTTKNNELLDEFHYQRNVAAPATPAITNTIEAPVTLPYTIESTPYSTSTTETLNSTEFQISSTSDFSIIEVDQFRHVDNYYGPDGANDTTQNIGLGNGILNYTIPEYFLNNGTFYARVRHRDTNLGWSEWSAPVTFTVEGSTDGEPLIYLDKTSYSLNENIEVTFINGPGGNTDWIGLYHQNDVPGNTGSTVWSYVDGATSGIKNFNLSSPGIYYAAFFINDGYTEITDRVYFYVGAIPTLSSDQTEYSEGSDVMITYTNNPNNPSDWIGVYKVGDPIGQGNETMSLPIDTTLDNVTFSGLPNAYYYAVYHVNGTDYTAGDPINFQIGDEIATIATAKTTFAQGEPITIDFTDGPGIEKDYIGVIIADGNPAGTDNLWTYKYFGGLTQGTTTIDGTGFTQGGPNQLPVVGNYYLAMFTDDSYTQVSNAIAITITDDPAVYMDNTIVNANESFDIHFVNAPGYTTDWLGIYNSTDVPQTNQSVTYQYINGELNGTRTFTLPNAGDYYVALFENDGYNNVSGSLNFTVRGTPVLSVQNLYSATDDVLVNLTSGGLPNVQDWVAIYEAGTDPSPSTLIASMEVTTAMQNFNFNTLPEGLYYATYHTENTYNEVGNRVYFQVGNQVVVLATDASDYYIGNPITFTVTNATGDNEDYVAIYTDGSNPATDNYISYTNLNAITNGSVLVDGTGVTVGSENYLPENEGIYFAVVIDATSGDEISNRVSFVESVGPTAVMAVTEVELGEDLVVTYANGPGNSSDWIGAYGVNETPGNELSTTWDYVDGANTVSGTITLNGINTEGEYFIALFENDGYTEVSERFYFTVVNNLGTEPITAKNKVELYPNPSMGIAYIKTTEEIEKIEVYNASGKLVKFQGQINQTTTTLNLKPMARGMYIVKVYCNGKVTNVKLLLK